MARLFRFHRRFVFSGKAVIRADQSRILGYWVDGVAGFVTLPPEVLSDLAALTVYIISSPSISRKMFQILLGRWMPHLTLRRDLMSLFSSVWTVYLPPFVGFSPTSEAALLWALSAFPLASVDFRLSVSHHLSQRLTLLPPVAVFVVPLFPHLRAGLL